MAKSETPPPQPPPDLRDPKTPEELKYLAHYAEISRNQTQTSCETKMELFV